MAEKLPALMIALGKKSEKSSPEMEDDDEVSKEAVEAAGEFASAVKSGNAKAIAVAFKNMKSLC